MLREAHTLTKAKLGPDHPGTLLCMSSLANGYSDAGKLDLALPLFEETLRRRKVKLGPDHSHTLTSMSNLASAYKAAGRLDLALPLLEETVKLIKAKLGSEHPHTLTVMNNLGRAYIRSGESAKAEALLRECSAIGEKKQPDAWTTFDTKSLLGAALLGQKKYSEAEPLLLAGYQGLKQREARIPVSGGSRLVGALERLVQLYEALGKKHEAKEWREKLAAATARAKPAAKP